MNRIEEAQIQILRGCIMGGSQKRLALLALDETDPEDFDGRWRALADLVREHSNGESVLIGNVAERIPKLWEDFKRETLGVEAHNQWRGEAAALRSERARNTLVTLSEAMVEDVKQAPSDKVPGKLQKMSDWLSRLSSSGSILPLAKAEGWRDIPFEDPVTTTSPILSGLDCLDGPAGGFVPGEMVVIGAGTGQGKSALGMQIALNASRAGVATMYFSFEMNRRTMLERIIRHEEQVDEPTRELWLHYQELLEDRGFAVATEKVNAEGVREAVVNAMANRRIGLVVIDYLGLMLGDRNASEYERVSANVTALKMLAMEFGIVVVVVQQINREGAKLGKPALHHLRSSGQVEQDADQVVLLHCEDGDNEHQARLAKCRRAAATGWRQVAARLRYHRFDNLAGPEASPIWSQ